jgi:AcrR family transcriptional regulator
VATATVPALPRTRREQQRLETRELLFELAIDEFRRVGKAKARIRDIVEAAGVVPGTFYFHFPSKDHVIFELWRRNSLRLLERLPSLDAAPPPGVERYLHSLGDAMIDIEDEIGDSALVRDSIGVVLRPPEGADPSSSSLDDSIIQLLAGALERGEIASELDPPGLASVLLTSILGVLISAPDDTRQRRRELRRTIDFFLKALHS